MKEIINIKDNLFNTNIALLELNKNFTLRYDLSFEEQVELILSSNGFSFVRGDKLFNELDEYLVDIIKLKCTDFGSFVDLINKVRGIPDYFVWKESDCFFIEAKANNDALRTHQLIYIKDLERLGLNTLIIIQNKLEEVKD